MKKAILSGRDYCEVALPKEWTQEEKDKLQAILQDKSLSYSDFINRSEDRVKSGEKMKLLWDIPQSENGKKLTWNGIVGLLRLNYRFKDEDYDVSIKLKSRFDQEKHDYFLRNMILDWLKGNDIDLTEDEVEASWEDLFRFLWIPIFKIHLLKTDSTGIYKTYQFFEENAHRIRGQIDIARHIRLNMGLDNGMVASKYRENTTDNYLNHLIIHTYLVLKKQFPELTARIIDEDEKARSIIRQLMYEAPSYARNDVHTLASKLQSPIAHPFFINHEELRKVCLRILSYTGASVFHESEAPDMESESMLFYVPDLWETYIKHCIFSRIKAKNVSCKTQVKSKDFKGILNTCPDFVVYQNRDGRDKKRIVLDAKFKPAWEDFGKKEEYTLEDSIGPDIRQCLMYQALLQAEFAGTIFPVRAENNQYKKSPVSGYDRQMPVGGTFQAIGVGIPDIKDTDTFASWKRRLERNEAKAAEHIEGLLLLASQ